MLTQITIHDYMIDLSIGIHPHEKESLQPLLLNLDLWIRTSSIHTDQIDDTIDYDLLTQEISKMLMKKHYDLLEHLAHDIFVYLEKQSRIDHFKITVKKPQALSQAKYVSVTLKS